jgi:nucleotide-binding universal stress UspA family protein
MEPAAEIAFGLAQAHGAGLTVCCLCPDPEPALSDGYVLGEAAADAVLARRDREISAMTFPLELAFRAAAAKRKVAPDWLVPDPNGPQDELTKRAQVFDLAILARGPTRSLASAIASQSGGPCILAARKPVGGAFERIVVAWNGSPQARRALDDAMPLLARAQVVELLVLGDDPAWLDHCSPERVVHRLARHGVAATLRILPHRGGEGAALALACEAVGADLLVMGAYSHSRARESVLGGATRAVLADFPIPVLMSH